MELPLVLSLILYSYACEQQKCIPRLFGFSTIGLSKIAVIGKPFIYSASVKLPLVGTHAVQYLS
jgi:hypothetical protein